MKYGYRRPPIKTFKTLLDMYNIEYLEIPEHYTSQLCQQCGTKMMRYDGSKIEKMAYKLRDKEFSKILYCHNCNRIINRDWNAAINILQLGYELYLGRDRSPLYTYNKK